MHNTERTPNHYTFTSQLPTFRQATALILCFYSLVYIVTHLPPTDKRFYLKFKIILNYFYNNRKNDSLKASRRLSRTEGKNA